MLNVNQHLFLYLILLVEKHLKWAVYNGEQTGNKSKKRTTVLIFSEEVLCGTRHVRQFELLLN